MTEQAIKRRTPPLRRGWTTGACATAAAKAAYTALVTGEFPDPVVITLPRGEQPSFALATTRKEHQFAAAGIVKDAGDDPDVTHGALVIAAVRHAASGSGVVFRAGEGVGTVTRPGLPLPPGEPAINPGPRQMIRNAIEEVVEGTGASGDVEVEIAIPGGEQLAERTLNPRLGIVRGLSILGTTGIVIPYSCSAWIAGIRQGIDVARALGITHIAGATGRTSEQAIMRLHGLSEAALIDMGDFVGAMLKHLCRHPVPRVSIAGGVAKITKLAQGMLDLHSRRGSVDLAFLAALAESAGASTDLQQQIIAANTAAEAFEYALGQDLLLGDAVAHAAQGTALTVVTGSGIAIEVVLFDREGRLAGRAPFASAHDAPRRKRRS